MDPQTDLPDLIEDLEANIDDLTTALQPLLSKPLHTQTSTLPLLDKAKLHVLSVYAIESILFSTLQASGLPAKDHAVFKELARLKTYFAKIKQVEAMSEQPKTRLDKEAAARFIKHGLAGNDKYDQDRKIAIAREKARAAVRAAQLENRTKAFDQVDEGKKQEELRAQAEEARKRKAEEMEEEDSASEEEQEEQEQEEEENHVNSENEDFYGTGEADASLDHVMSPASSAAATPSSKPDSKSKKDKKERKEEKKRRKLVTSNATSTDDSAPRAKEKNRRTNKTAKRLEKMDSVSGQKGKAEYVLPERGQAPKSRSQTFSALLDGTFAEARKGPKAKKGKK